MGRIPTAKNKKQFKDVKHHIARQIWFPEELWRDIPSHSYDGRTKSAFIIACVKREIDRLKEREDWRKIDIGWLRPDKEALKNGIIEFKE